MNHLSISELRPELPELASKQIRGIVTLIWPFSSSARQFALLLGDPDFRLRRRHGQVRVRFSGSSARAVANTGVGIGDKVVLSLQGVEFVRDGSVSTPGKSIDWELAYSQTLSARITREGSELADLDLHNAAPTPAPRSSPRPPASIESPHQWSSPVFLKRMRLSDIPSLKPEPAYQTLADNEHAKKRQRRSYKDWNAWTYVGRTPSPDKEDAGMEMLKSAQGTPVREVEMPDTPVSSARTQMISEGDLSQELAEQTGLLLEFDPVRVEDSMPSEGHAQDNQLEDELAQGTVYDGPYGLPNEQHSGIDSTSLIYGTDDSTDEAKTSAEYQEPLHDAALFSSINEDPIVSHSSRHPSEAIELSPKLENTHPEAECGAHALQETSEVEPAALSTDKFDEFLIDDLADRPLREHRGIHDHSIALVEALGEASETTMPPPPTLSLLQTDFRTIYRPGMLTPIGKEPSSPNLQPLDSSTLPMPSPFPGERDGNISSYLDFVSPSQPPTQQTPVEESDKLVPDDEADYILETSFYSSISSSKAPAFHPTHESAFTDVRFTFGLDGAALSRPHTSSGIVEEVGVSATNDSSAGEALFSSPIQTSRRRIQSHEVEAKFDSHTARSSLSLAPSPPQVAGGDFALVSSPGHCHNEQSMQPIADVSNGEHGITSDQDQMVVDQEYLQGNDVASYQVSRVVVEKDYNEPGTTNPVEHSKTLESIDNLQNDSAVGGSLQQSTANLKATGANVLLDDSNQDIVPEVFTQPSKLPLVSDEMEQILPNASPVDRISITRDMPCAGHEVAHAPSSPLAAVLLTSPYDDQESTVEPFQKMYTDPRQTGDVDISVDAKLKPKSLQETVQVQSTESNFSSFIDIEARQAEDEKALDANIGAISAGEHDVMHHSALVPDTSPVRNPRSKAKALRDPELVISTNFQTGSTLASLSEDRQEAILTPAAQFTSLVSPTSESLLTSEYHTTSPFNRFSPVHITSDRSALTQDRSSAESISQHGPSVQMYLHSNDSDLSQPKIDPCPRLEIPPSPRDTFVNKPSSQASEEGNMHTGPPSSIVQHPNDTGSGVDSNDSLMIERQVREHDSTPRSAHTTSREAASPAHEIAPLVKAAGKSDQVKVIVPVTIQRPLSSPTKSIRSVFSSNAAPNTPRRSRRINKGLPDILGDADIPDADTHIPSETSDDVIHAAVTTAVRSDVDTQSSPPTDDESITAVESEEPLTTSPQVESHHTVCANQHLLLTITPNETQNTLVGSQTYLTAAQEHTLPPSPRLTQTTSTAHDSFGSGSLATQEHFTMPATKSESRHDTVTTDVASLSASERSVHSASDAKLEAAKMKKPSIGLSTPIAYYTPLKDLPYFLNRSSAFHSAGSPDILALVTTPSTPPTRASKGPKHHTTTLHITDLSIYPSQTTVQVFRAYANALPVAEPGDVVLLRGMSVKSLNRHACLVSADESAWCVWRYGKPLWGKKRGAYGEMKSREEIKGPAVERGEGEWAEVEKIRGWYMDMVKEELEEKVKRTRSKDKQGEDSQGARSG